MTRQAKKSASVAEPTRGQLLALDQLKEIEAYADGELEIIEIGKPKEEGVSVAVELSIRTKAFRATGGLKFRDRESFFLHIPANFPLKEPSIGFGHRRFLGAPHVQWGYHICLYLSVEAEWVPSDGMYGFMQRLAEWLDAAGKGELDPDDAPLHPPAAYVGGDKHFVFRADAPAIDEGCSYWLGLADLKHKKSWRFDAVGWRALGKREENPPADQLVTALLLSEPFPFEYPTNVWDLVKTLEAKGISFGLIVTLLEYIALTTPDGEAGYMILGAPMRRPEPGGPTLQHLTTWEIENGAIEKLRAFALKDGDRDELRGTLAKWMVESAVRWCYFHEDRAEVTKRRDEVASTSFVREKRILLLGCGALGSNVAECLVRAGAKSLHLVDNGIVSPGLLVRQNFKDGDVGLAKARSLESLLNELELGCDISADVADISKLGLHALAPEGVDLIIDATASRRVAHRLEQDLKEKSIDAPMLSVSVDGSAEFASVFVRMPDYVGGPVRLTREAKISALRSNSGHAAVKAFWPRTKPQLFLPEPGCSDPTFTGSYADVSALA
ncbi:MAG: ThiF family adenylyltransferase, partial [Parvularcula sp.]|nr:ThiF family adenylyltransferase [Parvularcula sp.]